jgi:cobalt-zinc-cadmium efflux system outer membrane protein
MRLRWKRPPVAAGGWLLATAVAWQAGILKAADPPKAGSRRALLAAAQTPAVRAAETAEPEPIGPPPALTLDALEQMARENNPTLAQRAATVEAARGRQIQAALRPNPTLGYVASEIGNEGRAGQQGISVSQEFVRRDKLRLAQAVAGYERDQAQLEAAAQLFRVLTGVRTLFYETLAAQRTMGLTEQLVRLAGEGVGIARERERAGEATKTELLQAQIELDQVRISAANAANAYRAAWQRLAASVGRPDLQAAALAGDLAEHDAGLDANALDAILAQSPELQIALAGVQRAQAALERARVEPRPNLTVQASTQYDFASRDQITGVAISAPLPLRNRNQGNILAAESELLRAQREVDRVKLSITERFASAFARYRTALEQVERYGAPIPDAEIARLLTLRGDDLQAAIDDHPQIIARSQVVLALTTEGYRRGEFGYLQVLTAQRTLAQASLAYVRALAELRQGTVAIQGLLLTDALGAVPSAAAAIPSGAPGGPTE